jgi:hypothetical protein
MRRFAQIIATGVMATTLASPAYAGGDDSAAPPLVSCGNGIPGGIDCIASKTQLKQARQAFASGLKLQDHKRLDQAFAQFDKAARLVPQNPQFLNARELVKAQLVFSHVERGNQLLLENSRSQASAEFRAALDLDPENQFVRERLEECAREPALDLPAALPDRLADAVEIHLQPRDDRATFHFSGDIRSLFAQFAPAYGVAAQLDDSVKNRQVHFNVDDVDFFTALKLACEVSKTMWSALDAHQFLVADDSLENHKQFDRMSLETFTLPPHSTPQEAIEVMNTLRTVFDLRFITVGQTANTLEIRAPQPILAASARLLEQLDSGRPQVMLDVRIFQISHQFTRDIGLHVPNTFNMYNIPATALAGLAGQNIQQLINQLVSSGAINQAGNSALAGLLAQLGGQQNSIFSQPLATFGGGLTFMGMSLDQIAGALSLNESWARNLEHLTMRASQGNDATFHLGERYPILNASYAPIYNSPQISQVLGNKSYVAPFPSVSYEDLGLSLKAKPAVHSDGSISLQLELQLRSLAGTSSNGVPVISNREYTGSINLKGGEPAVVAGEISRTDQLSMNGIPGLASVPGLNQAMSNSKEQDMDELMIIITPYVVADVHPTTPEIWISQN